MNETQLKVEAAKAMARVVEENRRPMTLRELKAATLPRSSWEHFADVALAGHRAGVLVLSRIDLPQAHGGPEVTGEIQWGGSTFHWVKPRNWIG